MACASAAQPNELQQQEEQGDYVQIEVEGGEHVLLGRNLILPVLAAQDELRVSHQVLQRQRRDAQLGGGGKATAEGNKREAKNSERRG